MEKGSWFTSRQKQFVELAARSKYFKTHFYLTDGTALSTVYFNHRESDDLDFFSKDIVSVNWIKNFLRKASSGLNCKIHRQASRGANSYQFVWSNEKLKIEFMHYAFKSLSGKKQVTGIKIDSVEDIAANKMDTILSRTTARDYVDIYIICQKKKWSLKKMIKLHRQKQEIEIEPITWVKSFLKACEAKDFPTMRVKFGKTGMYNFFERGAKELESNVFG